MSDTTIHKSIFLSTDQDTVWDHLTRAELMGKWFHPADADLAEGQDYVLTDGPGGKRMCWGNVQSMTPKSHMRWSFTVEPMAGAVTTVDWHVEPVTGGTKLTLKHSGLPNDAAGFGLVAALDKGWHGFVGKLHDL
ncbi:MAG: SRPBCC family protein [Paracoccaceae bacterium]